MVSLISKITHLIKSSLKNKLIAIFLGIVILPLLITIYFTYERFTTELRKSYVTNTTSMLDQLNKRLDDYFTQLYDITRTVGMDNTISNISSLEDIGWVLHNNKLKKLNDIFFQRKETNSVLFYYPINKELFVINKQTANYFQGAGDIEKFNWYKSIMEGKNKVLLQPTHKLEGYDSRYMFDSETPVFSISRNYTLYLNGRIYGVLTVNYNLDSIRSMCSEMIPDSDEEIIYTDKAGQIFYASDMENNSIEDLNMINKISALKTDSGAFEYTASTGNKKWLIVYSISRYNGNILFKLIPINKVYGQAKNIRNVNLLVSIIMFAAFIIAVLFVSHRIIKPLSMLEKTMSKVGNGDFESCAPVTTSDEVGKMSNSFNIMIKKINNLINEKYKMQLVYRLSQLKALQAQINPHFLYNTLQAIGSISLKEGNKDLYKMTMALSDMLRYSIKSGGDMVTISDEVRSINNYLFIQKFRFKEKLNYTIDIPEELYKLKIPKLIFQPIVENAIIHGIEPGKNNGLISINCKKVDERLIITINDNGVGMDRDELLKIQTELADYNEENVDESEKIGILNVFHRLRLTLGDKCRLTIESEVNIGTKIEISFLAG